MVANYEITYSRVRWLNYLALSVMINFIIANNISIKIPVKTSVVSEMLKINLMSLAIPKKNTAEDIVEKTISVPKQSVEKKVSTQKKAKKKINTQEPVIQARKVIKQEEKIEQKQVIKNNIDKLIKENIVAKNVVQKNNHTNIEKQQIINNLDLETVIQEAKYRKQVAPNYPRRSVELGQQGNVTLHALVNKDGVPSELKIMQSSGHSLLDKAALAAVSKWEFEPTKKNGITVASWVRVPVEFIIQ